MTPAHQNALFLQSAGGPLVVGQKPVPTAGPGELLVRIEAAALNPLDWKMRAVDRGWIKYPGVLGSDAAGVVAAFGEGVTNLAQGDRVIFEAGIRPDRATFQQYALATAAIACKIPQNISFAAASSIPLGLATACIGLYGAAPSGAGLEPFWAAQHTGKPIVILGGASSSGSTLAKLSGFSPIITTASPSNTAHLLGLGATHVLPRALSLAELEAEALKLAGGPFDVVFDTVALPATQKAAHALLVPGGTLVLVLALDPDVKEALSTKPVEVRNMFASFLSRAPELGKELYARLEGLLESGKIKPNRVQVLPGGLAGIDAGLGMLQRGEVSGIKLVARPHEPAASA